MNRFLMLVHPPGDGFFGGEVRGDYESRPFQRFENDVLHLIRCLVVQKQSNEVEVNNLTEFLGEIPKQLSRIAINIDGA
jgi:hypothetical protein